MATDASKPNFRISGGIFVYVAAIGVVYALIEGRPGAVLVGIGTGFALAYGWYQLERQMSSVRQTTAHVSKASWKARLFSPFAIVPGIALLFVGMTEEQPGLIAVAVLFAVGTLVFHLLVEAQQKR